MQVLDDLFRDIVKLVNHYMLYLWNMQNLFYRLYNLNYGTTWPLQQ